tara:strand:+ start:2758 stop:4716 length:1959 start_codon:yes stop_codon:yes gene_type:complete
MSIPSIPSIPYAKQVSAEPQPRALARQAKASIDRSPDNSKLPSGGLDQEQKIATAGETVPIVFCKRVSDSGGVWVAPPLLKTGTEQFVSSFLYSISQGEIVSSPALINVWAGLENQALKLGASITLSHVYRTDAQIAAAPTTCPIVGGGLYCGIESFSYLMPVVTASVGSVSQQPFPSIKNKYYGLRIITRGTGDTDNTTFIAQRKVLDRSTGNDVTTAYKSILGISSDLASFNTSGSAGRAVGTILDAISIAGGLTAPSTNDFSSIGDGSATFTFEWTSQSIDTQTDSGSSADTGTLTGTQNEVVVSEYATPDTQTITDASSYADITFLKVVGNLFEQPASGAISSNARQLYIYYEEGVKVDLYSSGLSGGSYTRGASNQLVDLAMYLFQAIKRVDGANTASISTPIRTSNMQNIAAFCTNNNLFFNGAISSKVNVIDFIDSVAPCFLLSFLSVGGQYEFRPVLPVNASNQIDTTALTAVATFTESQILPGSFEKSYVESDDRRAFVASVAFRVSNQKNIGIEQSVKVRYGTTDADAPVEQFDLTDFCVVQSHAEIFAKHELARRKHSTHSISFQTPLLTTSLAPTDVIKVQRQRISTVGDNRTETEWYQVTSINHSSSGVSTVQAVHFPVNGSSVSKISDDVLNGTFTVV